MIGYLYGITSERRLVEDVGMHLVITLSNCPSEREFFNGIGRLR
ncbi:MAG: hypothetical protein JOZ48_12380 [Acidobacteriaceae bacterium]|nr:hypothetical protein [Acidobacteriaceae bacterium]